MNDRVSSILKSPWTIPVAVGVTAFGSGLGIGYILGRRTKAEEVVEEEPEFEFVLDTQGLAEARNIINEEDYVQAQHVVSDEEPTGVIVDETDAEIEDDVVVVRPDPVVEEDEDEPTELVQVNVFENQDEDWNWEEEIAKRDPAKPYVLHRSEFYRNEQDLTQMTLRYFKGDDVMVDEDDAAIYNHPVVVGDLMFGHGSSSPTVFYVRNEERGAEYEVTLEEGSFAVEILGLEAEEHAEANDLRHSKVGRFRMD